MLTEDFLTMRDKTDTKIYLKFNLITFLVVFLLSHSTIFIQKVNANSNSIYASSIYKTAWETINEKFYFKSKINLGKWKNKFENKINDLDDAHSCINKFVKELDDPYTKFLSKEEFAEEQNIINSMLCGIGVKLSSEKPFILDVLSESPAKKEGLMPNDYILAVDEKSTKNLSGSQTADLIRGEVGSSLTIKLKRGKEVLTKTLVREELKFRAVSSCLLDNNIALIKIDSFIPENTSQLVKEEITKLMSASGIILDLRNNAGGLLKNAIEIADMFLSEGKIISTINLSKTVNEYANSSQLYNSNIVILVNENTASASEILTSALKENKRAIVIGERTFGKGLVQEIVKLPDDSALHVTIAAYLTPNGNNLNKKGVIPDVVINNKEKQLEKAKEILYTLKEKSKLASL